MTRLATYDGGRLGVVADDRLIDVTSLVEPGSLVGPSAMRRLIADWDRLAARVEEAAVAGGGVALDGVRLEAPVPDPSKIIAAPINYVDHQNEMSHQGSDVSHLGVFLKAPSSIIGPGGTILLPYHDRRFDQEGEFALVIGRTARHVPVEAALDYVLGYTGLLDITMRGGEDRSTRKSFDTFTPLGPWLVTTDELGAPDDVELACSVNGQLRQKANTRDLIWGAARLVAYASSVMTLLPGDIVTTGTPAGVGPLEAGDVVALELSGIGRFEVSVAADGAVASPTLGASSGFLPGAPPPQGHTPAARSEVR